MSWLSSWLHPERGYQAGQKELEKYYNQAQGALNPYNQAGMDQYKNLQEYINNFMHPEKLQDEWIKNYKESEAAKNLEGSAQQHGLDAASAMGLLGSTPALQGIQAGTSAIGAQDRQNYLDDLMKKYTQGSGLASGIFNTGAGAAGQQSQNAMNMGQNSAGFKFGETNAPGATFGGIAGGVGKTLIDYLTGGMGTGSFGRGAWKP